MNGPEENSQENDQDASIPNASDQTASNPSGIETSPPALQTLTTLYTLMNRLQSPAQNSSTNDSYSRTDSTSDPSESSPEAMLSRLQIVLDNVESSLAHMPHLANAEAPSAMLPSHLSDAERPQADGPTYRPMSKAMDAFRNYLGTIGQTFDALDKMQADIEGAVSSRDSQEQEVPSPPSSSRQEGTSPQMFQLIASWMDNTSSSPSPEKNNGASPNAPQSFDTTHLILPTVTRSGQTNEAFLRQGLHILAHRLNSLTEDSPIYANLLSVFGITLLHLYEVNWDDMNLKAGVSVTSHALAALGDLHDSRVLKYIPTIVRSWAYGQRLLVQRDGDIEKLAFATELLKSIWVVSDVAPVSIRTQRFVRRELGACLFDQYTATGNLGDLESAIEHLQALSEYDDTSNHSAALGLAYYERFLQCGDLDDLDRALYQGPKACGAGDALSFNQTSRYDPDTAAGHHLFGLALAERFKMTLNIHDLDKAITNCQKAIALLIPTHPLFSPYKAALGRIFFVRYEAHGLHDLHSALEMVQSAVSLDKGGLGRHSRVPPEAIHGYFMAVDGEKRNSFPAVQHGIHLLSNARKMFSGPTYLESHIEHYLSKAMTCHFNLTKLNDDLEMAIHHASLAFNKTHDDSPYHFQFGLELGRLLMTSYERDHSARTDEAIAHFCSVAMSSTWPSIRLDAAIRWADASELCNPEGIIDALEVALNILPSLAWVGNRMPVQYRMLASQKSAIASRAVIHALDNGDPTKAISYLESGRNILWAQALQLRAEHMLPENERQHEFKLLSQHLANELYSDEFPRYPGPEQLADMVQNSPPEILPREFLNIIPSLQQIYTDVIRRLVEFGGAERAARDLTDLRELKDDISGVCGEASLHNAARRWDKLRSNLDELQGMLSPVYSFSSTDNNDLMAVVNQGSIFVVSAYGLRCDAIIISVKDQAIELHHVPLPDMSGDEAQAWAETLRQGMQDLQNDDITMQDYEEIYLVLVLRNLWKGLACPLLDQLKRLAGDIKRVWWYPTGPLMFLPIHAASPCEEDLPGLPELVISSYIPSIYSLIRASKSSATPFRILAVGQPETPGHSPLPAVNKEITSIQELCRDTPESLTTMIGEEGTVYRVTKSLPEHTSLHFSCHAHQDEEYPFHSAFFLHNGRLKLSNLMDLDLSRVQFAYLAACLTSAGDIHLPDECIHLAAGMQFVGVRSVIATMWSVDDHAAAVATSQVYSHLLRNGIQKADTTEAAEALHKAILGMKQNGVPLAFRVPFIHLGI